MVLEPVTFTAGRAKPFRIIENFLYLISCSYAGLILCAILIFLLVICFSSRKQNKNLLALEGNLFQNLKQS
jgi:hypothetical protein